mmetsp:Transcript_9144/g.13268  ORF Transcript_9144/g.13268 Transcript_9144/m.13268 type:complete len:446 (+) Transcript_9144:117-1454(+)|eukprot:CAMPEP_0195520476 /NCGR_PEP_ID=MMETSP0794_2-20130614/16989_1 /TAXON_ID=515487 /ORGANISM="Stephanopyxis turris, Strain CCMP 815" /LENGTH=445 /DNA_ID=CAMNT_0040649847 /DNA_START=111 /DNA_END=1448 /DNA_ORIENTATION=+
MGNIISSARRVISDTLSYYGCFFHFLLGKGRKATYEPFSLTSPSCPYFKPVENDSDDKLQFKKYARLHLYSLASVFYLWNKPHYRKGSYRDDLADNLRNVAIPGTGIPLSIFVRNRPFALSLLLVAYPMVSLAAAVHASIKLKTNIGEEYATRLLAPDDWFSYWRLNCRVAGLHALLNNNPKGYEMENKWTFLEEGDKLGVPVSPFLTTSGIVVKHRNEEGGMGIYFYKNATAGGDWIIQERIDNSEWVSSLLPDNAPLSTFRVITQSRAALDLSKEPKVEDITALSCVFRAGRAGAATDHDSILFDVDPKTGDIKKGTTNAHWYRLGLHEALPGRCPWRSTHHTTHHPDGNIAVTGDKVPDIKGLLHLVETSHLKLCPDVPLVGWDVVLSADPKVPVCLLEVNLSCNFFRGTFDRKVYLDFIDDSFVALHKQRLEAEAEGKKFK